MSSHRNGNKDNMVTHHVDILFLFETSLGRNNFQHLDVTFSYRLSILILYVVTLPFYRSVHAFILWLVHI